MSQGDVPANHGAIKYDQARDILLQRGGEGSYLFRSSESKPGNHVLCLCHDRTVYQYRVTQKDGGYALFLPHAESGRHVGISGQVFPSVSSLLRALMSQGASSGLVCTLSSPVPPSDQTLEECEIYTEVDDEPEVSPPGEPEVSVCPNTLNPGVLKRRFLELDLSQCEGSVVDGIKDYMERGVARDAVSVRNGGGVADSGLEQLMLLCSADLQTKLEQFEEKLRLVRVLMTGQQGGRGEREGRDISSLDLLSARLAQCQQDFSTLASEGVAALHTYEAGSSAELTPEVSPPRPRALLPDTGSRVSRFTVKQELSPLNSRKLEVECDVTSGRLLLEKDVYGHQQVTHLVKSLSNSSKVTVKLAQGKSFSLIFAQPQQRDVFCQLIQAMKNQHSNSSDPENISLFVGTWNMGDHAPAADIHEWLRCQGQGKVRDASMAFMPCDMYVIGTQETQVAEKEWMDRLLEQLKLCFPDQEFHVVTSCSMWAIRLVVIVHQTHRHRISSARSTTTKTGLHGTLGNKGSVAVSVTFCSLRLLFVCAHLPARTENTAKRIQSYRDISKSLGSLLSKPEGHLDPSSLHHHTVWLGDLNFRVDGDAKAVIETIQRGNLDKLLETEQLNTTRKSGKAFFGYEEAAITFKPTYKLLRGRRDVYDYEKPKSSGIRINQPSWTDRILWKSLDSSRDSMSIESTSYGCCTDIYTSDHSPVFATFNVRVPSFCPLTSLSPAAKGEVKVLLTNVEAEWTASARGQLKFQVMTSCNDAPLTSTARSQMDGRNKDRWLVGASESFTLPPSVTTALNEQTMVVAVVNEAGNDCYGCGIIKPIKHLTRHPQSFDVSLEMNGVKTGRIKGQMRVVAPGKALQESFKERHVVCHEYEAIDYSAFRDIDAGSETPPPHDVRGNRESGVFGSGVSLGLASTPGALPRNRQSDTCVSGSSSSGDSRKVYKKALSAGNVVTGPDLGEEYSELSGVCSKEAQRTRPAAIRTDSYDDVVVANSPADPGDRPQPPLPGSGPVPVPVRPDPASLGLDLMTTPNDLYQSSAGERGDEHDVPYETFDEKKYLAKPGKLSPEKLLPPPVPTPRRGVKADK